MNGVVRIWCGWFIALTLSSYILNAQPAQYLFKISFKDKQGAPPVSSALTFLSQRALDRRSAQGIAVDSTDRPVSPVYINDVLTTTGGKFHVASKWLNTLCILLSDSSQILTLAGKPYINGIQYTGYYQPILHLKQTGGANGTPSPRPKATGSAAYYGDAFDQTNLVRGDYLHDRGFRGEGKLIAVLDAGFTSVVSGLGFDSLVQSGRIVDAHDFAHASNDVYGYSDHGTQCLSTMAAYLPGIYVGSAPLARYALYITEIEGIDQPAEMDNMVAGLERADSIGADVISSSLGYNTFQAPSFSTLNYIHDLDGKTTPLAIAVNMATSKGMFCAISAGNEGGGFWNYILTPGDADSAETVGSVNIFKDPASNTGFGPNSAGRVKPDVCLLGNLASVMQSSATPFRTGGTSFATPQLAGWAACLWQATTNSTPYKLRSAINESAHMFSTPGPQIGYGVPDFGKAFEIMGIRDVANVDADNWLNVYPNPFHGHLTLWFYMPNNNNVTIKVLDVIGRQLFTKTESLSKGKQILNVDLPELASGVYYLHASSADRNTGIKLVKQ